MASLDTPIATKILNWLLNINWSTSNGVTTNPGKNQLPDITDVYLALYTVMPSAGSDGTMSAGTEVSGGNYVRQKLTTEGMAGGHILSSVNFVQRKIKVFDPDTETWGDEETDYVAHVSNPNNEIHFLNTGETGSGYGSAPVVGVGIFTARTGGTRLMRGKLKEPVTFDQQRTVPVIKVDNIDFTLG